MLTLSIRSRNAITYQVDKDLDLDGFTKYIFSLSNFASFKMINVGKKSIPEIEAFLSRLKQFILEV
jgi:hypothetical protein